MTIKEATKILNIEREQLVSISKKSGLLIDSEVPQALIDGIRLEQETYISFREYASGVRERYDGRLRKARTHLLDYLELKDYYGIQVIEPEDLWIGTDKDIAFFSRTELEKLDYCLTSFFALYSLTESEKVDKLILRASADTADLLRQFMLEHKEDKIGPTFTEFVAAVVAIPSMADFQNSEIKTVIDQFDSSQAKELFVRFLKFAQKKKNVQYGLIQRKKTVATKTFTAYPDETYLALAKLIFSPQHIDEKDMIPKALNNHIFIEMWMYLSLHYCCGWRAGDICRQWKYPRLQADNPFGISIDTLSEDILYDRISDETYEAVCDYALRAISLSGSLPHKTAGPNTPTLVMLITPELRTFFGLLTLISEAVFLETGDGYMKSNRIPTYSNRMTYSQFFGEEMCKVLNNKNILSRRLNKDYLQGIEETARRSGCGGVLASAVASFARSHNSLDTIRAYLQDHALNSETAEMVLYFMLERGAFSVLHYRTLCLAYPNAMQQLPMKQQTEVIKKMDIAAYELEAAHAGLEIQRKIKSGLEVFGAEERKEQMHALKAMFEISQLRGKAKDSGIYCVSRACGEACIHPEYSSCLGNACPNLVFVRYGYKALIEVLLEYQAAAKAGNAKMRAVYKNVIWPRFVRVINELFRETHMPREEKAALQAMLIKELENGSKCNASN